MNRNINQQYASDGYLNLNLEDKRILVTGGAGHIGSELLKQLSNLGCKALFSIDDYSNGFEANHIDGCEYICGNTVDFSKYFSNKKFDTIFHFGEFSRVEQSFKHLDQVYRSNYAGTLEVIKFCMVTGTKLIYSCSSAITSMADPGIINSPYTITKSANRNLINSYFSLGYLNGAIVYFSNVYGGNENGIGENATVIAKFLNAKTNHETVTITAPGTQRRNFTYINDIIDGILLVYAKGKGDDYFLANPESFSIIEVADMIGLDYVLGSEKAGNRIASNVDLTKVTELGWTARTSLQDFLSSNNR